MTETLFADVSTSAKKYGQAELRSGTAMQMLLDTMIANYNDDGDLLAIFDKPLKGNERHGIYTAAFSGLVASFGPTAVKLADTKTSELSELDKATKRYNRQQVGARLAKVRGALDKRLNPDKFEAAKARTDDNVKIPIMVAELRKRIETSETYDGDLVAMADWMALCPISPSSE